MTLRICWGLNNSMFKFLKRIDWNQPLNAIGAVSFGYIIGPYYSTHFWWAVTATIIVAIMIVLSAVCDE